MIDAIRVAEERAQRDAAFSALYDDLMDALIERRAFDLGRLYDAPYDDFDTLVAVLKSWRLQRYNRKLAPSALTLRPD